MLPILKNTWRKVFRRIPALDASRLRTLDQELSAGNNQEKAVLAELQRIQGDIDSFKTRDAELAALNERVVAMEATGQAASREIAALRECLVAATARQEKTDNQIRLLLEGQEAERREHQTYVQESMSRERRQNRRLGWSLLLACCALLLGTLATTATLRDGRQYAGLLADLSRDIKDLKTSMERQVAARQTPDSTSPAGTATTPDSSPENAAAPAAESPDTARESPDIAATMDHYHPHNKYRNREEMLAFFTENASEPGMVSVADGLQYRVVDQGGGKSPGVADTVILDYSAFLLDGTQLFSSYDEPLPVQFSVSQLVPGLREVVQRMEVGARWEVYVSPDHAYRGGVRKRKKYGYEPLLYVVELRSVIDAGDSTL